MEADFSLDLCRWVNEWEFLLFQVEDVEFEDLVKALMSRRLKYKMRHCIAPHFLTDVENGANEADRYITISTCHVHICSIFSERVLHSSFIRSPSEHLYKTCS